IDDALFPYPPIAALDGPRVQPHAVARRFRVRERVQRELRAGIVQKQVVGLVERVHTGARSARINGVDLEVRPGAIAATRGRDEPLEGTQAPRPQPNYRYP